MIEFKKLSWPKGLNLHLLSGILPEEVLKQLISENSYGSRLERRIVLPSNKCLKKIVCHHLYVKHQGDLDKCVIELRDGFKTQKELGVSKKKIRKMYAQRKKEIEQEKC